MEEKEEVWYFMLDAQSMGTTRFGPENRQEVPEKDIESDDNFPLGNTFDLEECEICDEDNMEFGPHLETEMEDGFPLKEAADFEECGSCLQTTVAFGPESEPNSIQNSGFIDQGETKTSETVRDKNILDNCNLKNEQVSVSSEMNENIKDIVKEAVHPTQQIQVQSSSSSHDLPSTSTFNAQNIDIPINQDTTTELPKPVCESITVILPTPTTAEEDAIQSIADATIPATLQEFKKDFRGKKLKEFSSSIPYRGVLCALLCSLFYSISCFIVSQLITVRHYGASYCFFWRFVGVVVPGIIMQMYYSWNKIPVFETLWKSEKKRKSIIILSLRVLMGIASIVLHYVSLKYIEIGDAATIVFSNPVLVTLIAWRFLGESMGCVPIVGALFTALGVVIISKPSFIWEDKSLDSERAVGIGLACGSMLCNSVVFVSLRFLKHVHFSVTGLIFGIVGLLWGIIETQATHEWKWPDDGSEVWDFFLLISLAVTSFAAQLLLTLSLKFEDAGPVSAIRTFDVVFSFAWQCMANHIPDILSVIGASIVVSSISVILLRKYLMSKPVDSPVARRWWFFLK